MVFLIVFQVLHQHFLTLCWNLTIYGSSFFTGFIHIKVHTYRSDTRHTHTNTHNPSGGSYTHSHTDTPVEDLSEVPHGPKMFSISRSFLEHLAKMYVGAPSYGESWTPPHTHTRAHNTHTHTHQWRI